VAEVTTALAENVGVLLLRPEGRHDRDNHGPRASSLTAIQRAGA